MTSDDIMDAIEGARDHGKATGSEGIYATMRPPAAERIAHWIVRTFRELDDKSVTVGEVIDLLSEGTE